MTLEQSSRPATVQRRFGRGRPGTAPYLASTCRERGEENKENRRAERPRPPSPERLGGPAVPYLALLGHTLKRAERKFRDGNRPVARSARGPQQSGIAGENLQGSHGFA